MVLLILLYRRGSREQALDQLDIPDLYSWQADAVSAILNDDDVFVSAPTGGGKSAVFQIPAIMESGRALTIVISPLRALQLDQVQALKKRGVYAELLNSDLSQSERKRILDKLPETCLLYLAPEQLTRKDLNDALRQCFVKRIVVDEAHVLPQTELDFRPSYGKIKTFIQELPVRPQIAACTATATNRERSRIIEALGMDEPRCFIQPVRRKNLLLLVKKIEAGSRHQKQESILFHEIEHVLSEQKKRTAVIVYCPTVARVERLHKWLSARKWKVGKYTGEMPQQKRQKAQRDFLSGEKPIMIATNAFGLGINKPDVRLIVHAGLPLTLSGYVQEIGRAGRDGKTAKCILFYSSADVESNKRILSLTKNPEAANYGVSGLNALKDLITSSECIWYGIAKYYGEKLSEPCGHCAHCLAKQARFP